MKNGSRVLLRTLIVLIVFGLPATASAQTSDNQRFTIIFFGDMPGRVFAAGPITGVGTVQPAGEGELALVFPQGTVFVRANEEGGSESFNEFTCLNSFTSFGSIEVTGGTGAFVVASGVGRYSGGGTFGGARTPQGCSDEGGIFFLITEIRANVTLAQPQAA